MSSFRITGLAPERFAHLFDATDEILAAHGARRLAVDAHPGYPDRIEMRDLELGEKAILVNYRHLDVDSPYRSSHAIFVKEGATEAYAAIDEIPQVLRSRLLSVRAFDRDAMMTDADVLEGDGLRSWILAAFGNTDVAFIDVHNAKRGCFAARVVRA